ncbi:MAG: tyrosine-type recombinase/integrase [Caldilineaceae bacterium]|nr:tyrosine-type recombinase/integrase [Caldilineaceae bacterium]
MSALSLLALFCQSLAAQNRSRRTILWYEQEVRRFFDWLERSGLGGGNWLRAEVVEAYLAYCRDERGNAPATVAGHYRALYGWFKWLAGREYIALSPMTTLRPPHVPDAEPRRTQVEEYAQLLDSIPSSTWVDARDRLIVTVLFLSGVRLGECARLQAADFRTHEHLLKVDGKTGPRLVPLLPAVERAFVAYLFARPASVEPRLFLAADGGKRAKGAIQEKGIYLMLRRRCQRAGLRMLNPHSFRHGLAMHLLNEGGDASLVQKVLGHAQITTTMRHYADWVLDGLAREFSSKMKGLGR